jgi:hypothetical protein
VTIKTSSVYIYAPYIPFYTDVDFAKFKPIKSENIGNDVYDLYCSFVKNYDIVEYFYRKRDTGSYLTEIQFLSLQKVKSADRKDMLDLLDV